MKKKIKIGIIGAGHRGVHCFGKMLMERDDVIITALCDPNETRMKKQLANLPGSDSQLYTSTEKMFATEKLDACIVTSPDCFHEENCIAALENGADVLVDKPLATSVKACRNIIATAEKYKKTIMVGFNLRHSPVLSRLKQIIDRGDLGKIFMIENREYYGGGRTYMGRWNRFYEKSGGLWIHKGSHDFDVFNWFLGFPKPVRVSAVASLSVLKPEGIPFKQEEGIQPGPYCKVCHYQKICPDGIAEERPEWDEEAAGEDEYHRDMCIYTTEKTVHDNGIALVEYENGVKASHMECFVTPRADRLFTIIGDKGQAEASLEERWIKVYPRWPAWPDNEVITYNLPEVEGGHGGADPLLLEAFIKTVKGDSSNQSTAEQGMLSTAIGQAAEIAYREHRTVAIKELDEL
jgi:predicted dehydrogenase